MKTADYEPRWYRDMHGTEGMVRFLVNHRETDLWIAVNKSAHSLELEAEAMSVVLRLREELDAFIDSDPIYRYALTPIKIPPSAPLSAIQMAEAARLAGVGPMAAVAGAFCKKVGTVLESKYDISDLIIENGGDIYLRTSIPRQIAIYAGESPLSNRIGFTISPEMSPLGICTSSGTVGHSLSFGLADAVTILADEPAVADAYATAVGNMVRSASDIDRALAFCATQSPIRAAIIIIGDRIGFRGDLELTPMNA